MSSIDDTKGNELLVFTDEVLPESSEEHDLNWTYIGSVIFPKSSFEQITNALLNARYRYPKKKWKYSSKPLWKEAPENEWFERNNEVVAFSDCNSANKYHVAKRWLKLLETNSLISKEVKIKVSGIDMDKIERSNFGGSDEDLQTRIQGRIFRGHLLGSSSYFYGKNSETVFEEIWHHQGNQEKEIFPRILKTKDSENQIGDIGFLPDNHRIHSRNSKEFRMANLIQFVDIITGATSRLFHERDIHKKKHKLAWQFKPFVEKGMSYQPREKRSQSISFFPDQEFQEVNNNQKVVGGRSQHVQYEFYNEREIQREEPGNKSLKDFC